jgi:peptidoglycan/LPS O-acetylase OafA/YrhL
VTLVCFALALRLAVGFLSDRASENVFFILNYHLPGLLFEFLLGVLAWQVCHQQWTWHWRWLLILLGAVGWLGLATWFGAVVDAGVDASWLRGQISWLAALCFALMVCGTLAKKPSELNSAVFTSRSLSPLQTSARHLWRLCFQWSALWAGRLSYGVYLFHMAALQLVQPWREALAHWPLGHQGVAFVLTLLMALLCYRLCEDPLRQWGQRLAKRYEPPSPQSPV